MELTYRPRRLRRTPALRAMVREHQLSAADFIYPLFVHEGTDVEAHRCHAGREAAGVWRP